MRIAVLALEGVFDTGLSATLDTFALDVRYAARLLRRNPVFTVTAALSLAIGIGATTPIVTVANGLLLRRSPARKAVMRPEPGQ